MVNSCRNLAEEVAAGRLTREELDALMDRLEAERTAQGYLPGLAPKMVQIGKDIIAEIELATTIEKRNRLRNIIVREQLRERIATADAESGDPALGLQSAMVGVNTPFLGSSRSVDALAQGMQRGTFGRMMQDLRKAGVAELVQRMDRDMQLEVSRVMWDLSLKTPRGVQASPEARKIGEILAKYQGEMMNRENRAGAFIRDRQGYIVRQSHDPSRMRRAGKDAWVAEMLQRLDFDVMRIPAERRDAFLRDMYDELESGIRLTDDASPVEKAFKGPGNLAKKESAARALIFRNADAWFEYNEKFGRGNLMEAYMDGISGAARATALMEIFGPNPRAMFDSVVDDALSTYKGDASKREGFRRGFENLEAQFAEIDGSVNFGADTTAAQIFSGFRAMQTISKLGGAVISSITDLAITAANRTYHGRSLMDAWGDAFNGLFTGIAPGDKRHAAELLGAGMDGMLGGILSRFDAADNFTGKMHKAMNIFFRLNLMTPWTDANKRGQALLIGRDLAMAAERPFDGLSDAHKRLLTIYGIDAKKWEVARLAVRAAEDGRTYLFPGDIRDVRGSPFTGLSERQQERLRDEVQDALFALYSNEIDTSVLTAGARERAFIRRGYRPGTVGGEMLRMIGQFRSFPIAATMRAGGRFTYGQGYRTPGQMARGLVMGENMGLVSMIAGGTLLGYFALQAKEVIKGRSPRPANAETFIAAMMQGGGLGIYGDFLFGRTSRHGNSALETLAGPGFGTIAQAMNLINRSRDAALFGDEDVRGDALRLVQSNIPFANLFYAKAAMDYLLWYQLQEMINPGYLSRMERRVERDNGQTFWLPPSSVVERGGGFQ
jgi:hypothetical protein